MGCSEHKIMTQFSSFENDVRPGEVMTVESFFNLQQVHPSLLDKEAKIDHHVDQDRHCNLCE